MKLFHSSDLSFLPKRCVSRFLFALILVFLGRAAHAEEVRSFLCDLSLGQDGSLKVQEDIVVDFQGLLRHGLRRFIPITYNRGVGTYTLKLKVESVTDTRGTPISYRVDDMGPDISIKIGDPANLVSGVQSYRITYQVLKAINFFSQGAEIYWNVNGTRWVFPIDKCVVHFQPPDGVPLKRVKVASFQGFRGAKTKAAVSYDRDSIIVSANKLAPGENLTVLFGLPEGSVKMPTLVDETLIFIEDWFGLVLWPCLTAIALYFIWSVYGRDRKKVSSIAVEWTPPPDLTPAEVGTLIDEKLDTPDVLSTLVDLASRGYLKIKVITYDSGFLFLSRKDYQFTKTEPPKDAPPLKAHEQIFLDAVFPYGLSVSTLSMLKGKFSYSLSFIQDAVWDSLLKKKLFSRNPNADVGTFYVIGAIIAFSGIALAIFSSNVTRATAFGVIISGVFVLLSARAMPQRTALGSLALARCRAFQRFVQTAEKSRIEVLAKDDPTIFGRLLPYAMVLGAADKWAAAFKDLMVKPPDWYDNSTLGNSSNYFPNLFVSDLSDSMHSIASGFVAKPLPSDTFSTPGSTPGSWSSDAGSGFSGFSDGGGSSGGGFGGGGGSTW